MGGLRFSNKSLVPDLKRLNPGVRVLLTVSPVPLIATYEPRHVLVSTTYSKSVLRVAAEQVMRRHDWVDFYQPPPERVRLEVGLSLAS